MTKAGEAASGGAGLKPAELGARLSAHRLSAIDVLRGLVVALMALDHTCRLCAFAAGVLRGWLGVLGLEWALFRAWSFWQRRFRA